MNNVNTFSRLKYILLNIPMGIAFSRAQLVESLGASKRDMVSVDNYRNYFSQAGFLEKINRRGLYRKVNPIPEDITLNKLREMAYPEYYEKKRELKEDKMIMKDAQERADELNMLNSIKLKLKEFQGRTYKILKKETASNFSCPITWRDESGKVITHMSYDVQEALMVMKLLAGEMNINDLKTK